MTKKKKEKPQLNSTKKKKYIKSERDLAGS